MPMAALYLYRNVLIQECTHIGMYSYGHVLIWEYTHMEMYSCSNEHPQKAGQGVD